MKPVKQTRIHDPENGTVGNCWQACLASIFEIPIEDAPDIDMFDDTWTASTYEWLYTLDLDMHFAKSPIPNRITILTGYTNRFDGTVLHSCVGMGNTVVHDPHPSNEGILNIKDCIVFEPQTDNAKSLVKRLNLAWV